MNWNDLYETGETPWEKGRATPVLEEMLARHPAVFQGRAFVPGCGFGHDARWLAKEGCDVVGADIAPLAIERARAVPASGTLEFRLADIFEMPPELVGVFDLVWEHTCLSALEPSMRARYAAGLRSALRPGGTLAGVFFLNPDMDPGETGPPFGIPEAEVVALWQRVGLRVMDSWVPTVAYPGREGRELAMILGMEG